MTTDNRTELFQTNPSRHLFEHIHFCAPGFCLKGGVEPEPKMLLSCCSAFLNPMTLQMAGIFSAQLLVLSCDSSAALH